MRKNGIVDWEDEGREISIAEKSYVITLINPVNHRLFDVVHSGSHVSLICPDEKIGQPGAKGISMGNGHFDRSDRADGDQYARSHSPGGVVEQGVGYGLLLYSGMAVTAAAAGDFDGIFSNSSRSSEAESFWSSQVDRGYADEDCAPSNDWEDRNVTISVDEDAVRGIVEDEMRNGDDDYCDFDIEDIESEVEVTVRITKSKEIQQLSAVSVMRSGLVIAWDVENDKLSELEEHWKAPSLDVLYELKLDNCFDSELIVTLFEVISGEAGDKVDNQKLLKMLETAPPELLADPSDELFERMKESGKLHQMYLELAGQTTFDFDAAKAKQKKLVANQRHSPAWIKHFGSMIEAP